MDANKSLQFRGPLYVLWPAFEFGVIPAVLGTWGFVLIIRSLPGEDMVGWLIGLVFVLLAALFAAFGFFMLWAMTRETRMLTVSRREIEIHPWVGRSQTVDIGSLAHLVMYGEEPDLVFLPKVGPPLLTLAAKDFPRKMPEAISQHVGVQLEHLGDIDKSELGARFPKNAKQTAQHYELVDEWRDRAWRW